MQGERDARADITPIDLATLTAERDKALADLAAAKGFLIDPTNDAEVTKAGLIQKSTYDTDLQTLKSQLNAKTGFVDPVNYFLKTALQTEASKAG